MKKEKKSLKELIKNLTKKQKIIITIIALIMLLGIGASIFYFVKKTKKEPITKEEIVIELDNYIYKNGDLLFLNSSSDEIGKYKCKNKDETKCYVAYYGLEDESLNTTKYIYEDKTPILNRSEIFDEKYVFIFDNLDKEEIKLYDMKAKKTVSTFNYIKKGREKEVIVENEEGLVGAYLFNESGFTEKIPFIYKTLSLFNDSYIFDTGSKNGIIDNANKIVTDKINNKIVDFNKEFIVTKNNDVYVLNNYEGEEDDTIYDYIKLSDDLIFLVNNNRLTIRDIYFSKVNEEKLILGNKYYNHVYIFEQENKTKIKEEKAFSFEQNEKVLLVKVGDKEYDFNLYEPLLNRNFEFVNYLSGNLYIYKDEEKENLLYTYKCNNKNDITKTSTSFENCFLGKEKVLIKRMLEGGSGGYLPVYNENYAFINDSVPLSLNQNIYLIDFKTNKKVGPYYNVDAGFYRSDKIYMVESNYTIIMAENNKKKFGIFKIDKNSLTSVLKFENSSIRYLDNNLLAKKDDNKYYLYNESGTELATSNNEIEAYLNDYIIVKDSNNKYRVDSKLGSIVSSSFKYIILGSKYFAVLKDDNTIGLYKYTEPNKNVFADLVDPIKIEKTNDIKNSFMVVDSPNFKLIIYKNNNLVDEYNEFGVKI